MRRCHFVRSAVVFAVFVLLPIQAAEPAVAGPHAATTRVSVSTSGSETRYPLTGSYQPAMSADGRVVAFVSNAPDLVPDDTNRRPDIFVHDRVSRVTERVSVSTSGQQAGGGFDLDQGDPEVSADGRFVTFWSTAPNLAPGAADGLAQIYVRDREAGTTELVSGTAGGKAGNDASQEPSLSGDGRLVAFTSRASDLVPGDAEDHWDVFVHDRATTTTRRISEAPDGRGGNGHSWQGRLSGDGNSFVFVSEATNLLGGRSYSHKAYVKDLVSGTMSMVSLNNRGEPEGIVSAPSISWDGRYVTFSGGEWFDPGSGAYWDVLVRDRLKGRTELVSQTVDGDVDSSGSGPSVISANGRYVAFWSESSNLVKGDTNEQMDVFVRDLETELTTLVSVSDSGDQARGSVFLNSHIFGSWPPLGMSGDGRSVAFASDAVNLVPGDANASGDIFVYEKFDNPCNPNSAPEGPASRMVDRAAARLQPLEAEVDATNCAVAATGY